MHFPNSKALLEYMSAKSDTVILSFSNGKDSLVAWLVLRKYFKKVIPFYLYAVPGLEFIEQGLSYYEDFFKTKILRYPHPSFYRMLNNHVFQSPENCLPVEMAGLPDYDYDHVHNIIHEDFDLPDTVWVGTGITVSDSMTRRVALKRNGPLNVHRKTFFPIFDYKRVDLVREITEAKVRLPVDYRVFGRSFDGIHIQYSEPMKKHFPRDYKRLKEFFGMIEIDILRMRFREDYYNGTETSDENYTCA
jgi:hypothetical protein